MRLIGVMVLVATVLTLTLAACGEDAATAETAAESTPAATQAPALAATEAPATPPPAPTSQATAAPTEPPAPARPAAVDFSLPSAQGPQYTLSSFAGQQPVVVVFYRAFW